MGSPSALLPRLDGHCEHKLPTSCVLTSTQHCCACEDQRNHQATYTVYIDGAGLRPWAPRWINYCWPCKEYWDHRTGNGVIPSASTRIPEIPSQTNFLARWTLFYDQYWQLIASGASSFVIDTYQEPWREVDPGRLPRTRDEIRLGYQRSQYEMMIDTQQQHEILETRQTTQTQYVSVDDALDQLLDDMASDEDEDDSESMPELIEADTGDLVPGQIRLAEINLEPLEIPDIISDPIAGYAEPLGSRLRHWPTRLLSILSESDDEDTNTASTIDLGLQLPVELQPSARETSHMEQMASDPQTPQVTHDNSRSVAWPGNLIGAFDGNTSMFDHTASFQDTAEESLSQLNDHTIRDSRIEPGNESASTHVPHEGLSREQRLTRLLAAEDQRRVQIEFLEEMIQNASQGRELLRRGDMNDGLADLLNAQTSRYARSHQRLGLDSLPRPEALRDEAMMVRLECGICLQQIANIACVPCGHVIMCEWCAQIQMPHRPGSTSALQANAVCPKCRASVRSRVKLFF